MAGRPRRSSPPGLVLTGQVSIGPRRWAIGEARYDTHEYWEGEVALTYLLQKNFSLIGKYHTDYGFGGGLQIRF